MNFLSLAHKAFPVGPKDATMRQESALREALGLFPKLSKSLIILDLNRWPLPD
jgi:hypothetical protein